MDTLEIDDINMDLINEASAGFRSRNPPSRSCWMVSLGLLCALLLTGNVAQIIFYEIISRPGVTQANYHALTEDREQNDSDILTADRLQTSLRNLSRDNKLLQQSVDSLTSERDEFNVSLSNVKTERDQIQASYNSLKRESDLLKTSYSDVQKKLEQLQSKHEGVTASKGQLESIHRQLQRESEDLKTLYFALEAKEIQLERNYSVLQNSKEELQRSYDSLSFSKNVLQSGYSSLWKDKEQLQSRFNSLTREKQQLHANYSSLAAATGELQKRADKMAEKVRAMRCQTGWTKFEFSCYFVSTVKKNWTESRQACVAEGADLLVIDSREEQVFVNGLLSSNQNAWIGLTDGVKEGQWTWVDGTPVTTVFWQPGQPNNYNKNQDCGEYVHTPSASMGQWNDDGCFASQIWICET